MTVGHSASIRVRPRTNGTVAFDVRYRLDTRSKTTSFDNLQAAERWARIVRQIGAAEALKLLQIDSHNVPTVDEYAERYIGGKSGVEPRTLEHYRMYVRTSISPAMGALPIDVVLPDRIAAWINEQVAAGFAAKTIKNRHGFLSAMFQSAVDDGLVPKNPCARTRLPNSEQREMVFLSPDEYRQLLSYIPVRWRPFVQTLAGTGMRFGEATALRPTDFDLNDGTVRVARAWKASETKGWYIGPPKTKRSRRTISLPPTLVEILRPLIEQGGEYVFTNDHGEPIRQSKFYANTWEPARRLANGLAPFLDSDGKPKEAVQDTEWRVPPAVKPLGKWPRIHDLRHSHASWLLNDGIPLTVLQRRLGHESIQTSSDVYGHIMPDLLFRAAQSADIALTSPIRAIEA